jgi:hypothetical protein
VRHALTKDQEDNDRFFSALLQSSVPDDFFGDLRRMAKGELSSVDSNDNVEASKMLLVKQHLAEEIGRAGSHCLDEEEKASQ